jgi:hypothetical protein
LAQAAGGGNLEVSAKPLRHQRRTITMFALIALVAVAIIAIIIFSAVVHLLFSPWLLLLAAVGVLAWIKLHPRRSHQ